jgi:LPXTG-motif cell wall-anchored protein
VKLRRRLVAVVAGTALLGSVPLVLANNAQAATPPFEPDPNALGSIAFYDASGTLLTGGSNLAHLADYYAASTAKSSGTAIKATLYFAAPDHNQPTSLWFVQQQSASTVFPNNSAPPPLTGPGFANPLVTAGANDGNLTNFLAVATLDPTAGYANIIQVRVKDNTTPAGKYWESDISYNTTTGTWTQVFPVVSGPTATTTTLTVTPTSPQTQGTPLTLKATVSPASAAGSVQFFDGATSLGTAAVAGGVAQITNSTLAAGSHSLTATFTPTDSAAFGSSTSAAAPYTITSVAVATTTTISALPVSPVVSGTSVTFTATVSPAAAGTVQFFDGAATLGAPATVAGTATTTTSGLSIATHSVKATFTPTDPTAFVGSTSSVLSYTVTSVPATPTTTTLVPTPASPQQVGTAVTLTATVAPVAAGTVQFFDGATSLGTSTVAAGTATKTVSTLTVGAHSLKATFTPTDPSAFTPSTSSTVAYQIDPAPATPTTTALGVVPAGPVTAGTPVTLTATITPAAAAGAVQFFDGTTPIPGTAPVTAGTATKTVSTFTVATHTLTAQFIPTDPTAFEGSTSTASMLEVDNPPPGTTTTGLTVVPVGPVVAGTSVTLNAAVAPTTATGTVQFMDGATALGSPVTTSAGLASMPVSTLAVGTHSLTAVFTPDTAAFTGSTSAAATLVVVAAATPTTTTLDVTPTSPQVHGTALTLTATVAPADAVGSVQFLDGTTVLGSASVVAGQASITNSTLATGSHSLTAKFVPTDAAAFTASTSAAVPFTISTAPATPTTTTLAVTPSSGTANQNENVVLTATVSPTAAPGSVKFLDGTFVLATVPVSGGTASFTTKALGLGVHTLTAQFVPTNSADFAGSTSDPVTLTVQQGSTGAPGVSLVVKDAAGATVSDGATLAGGAKLSVTADGFTSGETVTITVQSTPVVLATVTADGSGVITTTVTLPASLAAGDHTLTVTGATSTATASLAFVVVAAGSGGGTGSEPGTGTGSGSLPDTGANIAGPLAIAFGLLVAGAVLVLGSRRRTQSPPSHIAE